MKQKKHWIAGAIKHPGAERNAARRAGMSTHAFMEKHKNSPGKAGKRARLGLRLEAMNHKVKGHAKAKAIEHAAKKKYA